MKQYKMNINTNKWIAQNNAEPIDCIDGCLLDSVLYITKRGMAALIETYVNSNSSCYTLYFSRDNKVEDYFYKLKEEREE